MPTTTMTKDKLMIGNDLGAARSFLGSAGAAKRCALLMLANDTATAVGGKPHPSVDAEIEHARRWLAMARRAMDSAAKRIAGL
jgi:hypothetical protein